MTCRGPPGSGTQSVDGNSPRSAGHSGLLHRTLFDLHLTAGLMPVPAADQGRKRKRNSNLTSGKV